MRSVLIFAISVIYAISFSCKTEEIILHGEISGLITDTITKQPVKAVAVKLNITPRAIDGYRDALFEKLDVRSRVGLAIYAVKNGIVTF